jgi:hypothetical protein
MLFFPLFPMLFLTLFPMLFLTLFLTLFLAATSFCPAVVAGVLAFCPPE